MEAKLYPMRFSLILDLHQVSLNTVQSIAEHLHICKSSGWVALSEGVCSNGTKAFIELGFVLWLDRVHFLVWISWFNCAVQLNNINIERDIEKFGKLLLNLIFQIKCPHVLLFRVYRMDILVPSVGLKSIEHVVVSVLIFSMIIKLFVWILNIQSLDSSKNNTQN